MNCDFINSLTEEQKLELRKLLDTDTTPKYRVEVEWWDNGNIKTLVEYLGDQPHGKDIGWYEDGQKEWEIDYYQGLLHGKNIRWHEDGQKHWEKDYEYGKLTKEYEV